MAKRLLLINQVQLLYQPSNTCVQCYPSFLTLFNVHVCTLSFIAVLVTIDSDIQSVTITEEKSANLTCNFSKGDLDSITVYWRVDGEKCNCHAGEDVGSEAIACYNTESRSVLLIRNTSSFTPGRHQVQCILQQNISEEFRDDRSFNDNKGRIIHHYANR